MFKYLFIHLGINCKNKFINYLFTSITITIFTVHFIITPFVFETKNIYFNYFLITINLLFVFTLLISYVLVKIKSNILFEIYNDLAHYYVKISHQMLYISCVIFISTEVLEFSIMLGHFYQITIHELHLFIPFTYSYLMSCFHSILFIYIEIHRLYLLVLDSMYNRIL